MKYPIRVLVLDTILERGGAETMMINYMRNMDRERIQCDFLVNREDRGDYEEEVESLGGRIFRMCPMYPQYFSRYKQEFRSFLQKHSEYRIVHSNLEERSYFPIRICAEMNIPVRISHAHSVYREFDKKLMFRNYFRYRLRPYPTHKFACSKEAGIWLYGEKEVSSNKVTVLPNAIDTSMCRFDAEKRYKMRKLLKIDDAYVIGHVGRLSNEKNHFFLLDVFYYIKKIKPCSRLLLLGGGLLEERLRDKARALDLLDSVIFTGSVPNVADYLHTMDVFVFPSLFEGLGMAAIEAQAAGLHVFASERVPAECDLTGNVTVLSLEDSPEKWAKKIVECHVVKDRSEYSRIVKKAGFDIRNNSRWLEEFYTAEYLKSL